MPYKKFTGISTLLLLVFFCSSNAAFSQKRSVPRSGVKSTRKAAVLKINTFDGALKLATAAFQKGNYEAAAEYSKKAIDLKPEDYRPYIILSNTHFKTESFDEALTSAQTARESCPEEVRTEIDELIGQINSAKAFSDEIKSAEAAAGRGNAVEAAEAYQRAYNMKPNREDVGLRAASIYNDQVKNYAESIKLVRQISLKTKDAEISAQAKDLLGIAEENLEREKENQRKKKEDEERRQVELRRLDAERKERERREAEERAREERSAEARRKIEELESKRDSLQREMESAQEQADSDDQQADAAEQKAASYNANDPAGAFGAGMTRIIAQNYRKSAAKNKATARRLQSEISQLDREISRLQRDAY